MSVSILTYLGAASLAAGIMKAVVWLDVPRRKA